MAATGEGVAPAGGGVAPAGGEVAPAGGGVAPAGGGVALGGLWLADVPLAVEVGVPRRELVSEGERRRRKQRRALPLIAYTKRAMRRDVVRKQQKQIDKIFK